MSFCVNILTNFFNLYNVIRAIKSYWSDLYGRRMIGPIEEFKNVAMNVVYEGRMSF